MIRSITSYFTNRRIARLKAERALLVCQAFDGKAGSQVAQHKLVALTAQQLRAELGL